MWLREGWQLITSCRGSNYTNSFSLPSSAKYASINSFLNYLRTLVSPFWWELVKQRPNSPDQQLFQLHRKKDFRYSRPQPGCHLPNSPWAGIMTSYMYKLVLRTESLISDIPAGDGNIEKLFYGVQLNYFMDNYWWKLCRSASFSHTLSFMNCTHLMSTPYLSLFSSASFSPTTSFMNYCTYLMRTSWRRLSTGFVFFISFIFSAGFTNEVHSKRDCLARFEYIMWLWEKYRFQNIKNFSRTELAQSQFQRWQK